MAGARHRPVVRWAHGRREVAGWLVRVSGPTTGVVLEHTFSRGHPLDAQARAKEFVRDWNAGGLRRRRAMRALADDGWRSAR